MDENVEVPCPACGETHARPDLIEGAFHPDDRVGVMPCDHAAALAVWAARTRAIRPEGASLPLCDAVDGVLAELARLRLAILAPPPPAGDDHELGRLVKELAGKYGSLLARHEQLQADYERASVLHQEFDT